MVLIFLPQSAIELPCTNLYNSCGCIELGTSSAIMSPSFMAPITISEQYQRGAIPKYVYDIGEGEKGAQYMK